MQSCFFNLLSCLLKFVELSLFQRVALILPCPSGLMRWMLHHWLCYGNVMKGSGIVFGKPRANCWHGPWMIKGIQWCVAKPWHHLAWMPSFFDMWLHGGARSTRTRKPSAFPLSRKRPIVHHACEIPFKTSGPTEKEFGGNLHVLIPYLKPCCLPLRFLSTLPGPSLSSFDELWERWRRASSRLLGYQETLQLRMPQVRRWQGSKHQSYPKSSST